MKGCKPFARQVHSQLCQWNRCCALPTLDCEAEELSELEALKRCNMKPWFSMWYHDLRGSTQKQAGETLSMIQNAMKPNTFRKQLQLASRKSQLQNDLYLTLTVPNAIRKYSNFLTNCHANNLKFPFHTTWPLYLSTYIAFSSKYLYIRVLPCNTSVLKLGGAGGKQQEWTSAAPG